MRKFAGLAKPLARTTFFPTIQPLAPVAAVNTCKRAISISALAQDRQAGQVKWFDTVKGFGFIVPQDGGPDIFVHQTSIISDGFRSLSDGEEVEFDVGEDPNGRKRADNVTGPGGVKVQGSPRNDSRGKFNNDFGDDDFGGNQRRY